MRTVLAAVSCQQGAIYIDGYTTRQVELRIARKWLRHVAGEPAWRTYVDYRLQRDFPLLATIQRGERAREIFSRIGQCRVIKSAHVKLKDVVCSSPFLFSIETYVRTYVWCMNARRSIVVREGNRASWNERTPRWLSYAITGVSRNNHSFRLSVSC